MNTFNGLVAYVLIGGVIATLFTNYHIEKCNKMPADNSITLAIFGWPVMLPVGLLLSNTSRNHFDKLNQCKE